MKENENMEIPQEVWISIIKSAILMPIATAVICYMYIKIADRIEDKWNFHVKKAKKTNKGIDIND